MKNYSTIKKASGGSAIIRYEGGKFLCPKGHEVMKGEDEFVCRKCSEIYTIRK